MKNLYQIKPNLHHMKGIFAISDIPANTNLGLLFIKNNNTGIPVYDINRTKLGSYINHSFESNTTIGITNKSNKFYLYTKYNIPYGKELTLDFLEIPEIIT